MRINLIQDGTKSFRIPKKILGNVGKAVDFVFKAQKDSNVNVVIASASKSKKLNKEFRHKDYIPDVLTFRYGKNDDTLGEIIIVPEVVKKQAKERKHSVAVEFTILLIHGIVHMLGYEHENVSKSRKASMRRIETKLLSELGLTTTDRSY